MAPTRETSRKRKREDAGDVTSSTSVSRLKSNIRQAKRLLAHDDVKLDLRQTTERRLEALETQLDIAQGRKKEQKLATRYHGVKFIERKKVVRKINQLKTQLAACSTAERKPLEASLKRYRIDLHYILTFPSDSKYIALFPDGVYADHDEPLADATAIERAALRKAVRKRIKRGDLGPEPELHLAAHPDSDGDEEAKPARTLPAKPARPKASRGKVQAKEATTAGPSAVAGDDFFDL